MRWVSLPIPSRRDRRDQGDGPPLGPYPHASAVPLHFFPQKTLEGMTAIWKGLRGRLRPLSLHGLPRAEWSPPGLSLLDLGLVRLVVGGACAIGATPL